MHAAEVSNPPALVIVGMHRSGTSLLASLCQGAGLHVGDHLLGAYPGNAMGHFEDLEFVHWHETVLESNGLAREGFIGAATPRVPELLRRQAEALVAARRKRAVPWGWKDPRTTLHLDFWEPLLPEARFLFLVRRPWEVVDSLYRRGDGMFRVNPPFALEVWTHYNRLIRDFITRHPQRSLIRDLSQVVERPGEVFEAVRSVLRVPLADPPSLYVAEKLSAVEQSSRVDLVAAASPEAMKLYEELAVIAGVDLSRPGFRPAGGAADRFQGFADWSECRTLEKRVQALEADHAAANMENAALKADVAAAQAACREADDSATKLPVRLEAAERQVGVLTLALEAERKERSAVEAASRSLAAARVEAEGMIGELRSQLEDGRRQIDDLARALDGERVGRSEAEVAGVDLRNRLADVERLAQGHEHERRRVEQELARVHASNSWRLTAPVRSVRRTFVSRPCDQLTRWASAAGRRWWRRLPLSIATKQRLRHRLFTGFAPLFCWTDSYREWHGGRAPAVPARRSTPAPDPPPVAGTSPREMGVRVIAMHLPQFHRIAENDAWWGDGFTEWTNVRRGRPMYPGHHQPRVPHADIGYYDLSDPAALERQASMASAHGIHGFCFYYYWFGGRRLLEKPLDEMLRSGRPEFPFCICWANENWTRTWDGRDTEILVAQTHDPAADRDFIRDVMPLLRDPRYIRVGGRPLLAVYRPESLADPRGAAATWRKECRDAGIGEIHLVAMRSFTKEDPATFGFDAAIQFPPLQIPARNMADDAALAAVPGFAGSVHDYAEAAAFSLAESAPGYRMYRGVMPSWDNTARRMERATSWVNSAPERYGEWLRSAIDLTIWEQPAEHRLVFINAWNEWAEGAHLEPDERHGYAYLAATAAALGVSPPRGGTVAPRAGDSLPDEPVEIRNHAWSVAEQLFDGELSPTRHGFLADHIALLRQLAAAGCRLRIERGRALAQAGGDETPLEGRRDLAAVFTRARGDHGRSPFCFVVLQFGRFDVTARCLDSLRRLRSRRPVRIVVVDNGSPADVLEATRESIASMPDVEVLETGTNLGFAGGNNAGYVHARDRLGAAFIAVINNDTRIEDVDFIAHCERLFAETAYSALGPDIVTPDGRRENPWNDAVYSPAEWRRLRAMYDEDRADFERTGQPRFRRIGRRTPESSFMPNPILQGAAIVLSPVFVRDVATLFDDRTKLYGEEFLFAVDALLAGHFLVYSQDVRILHEEGVSTGALPSATKMRLGYENAALAAGLAAEELDNFAAACRGEPIDCRSNTLETLVAGRRRHVLVDLFFCQPGYHGGGEYGKAVFRALARAAAARSDVQVWAALDPTLHIDPWVLAECRRLAIRVIAVRSYADIVALVNAGRFAAFFCPAIVVYTGYEYMRRAGTRLPFTGGATRVVGTLHDIRDLQLIRDREAIAATLAEAGWRPAAGPAHSFLAASAPAPADLHAMYGAIGRDPHVHTLVTVSSHCRGVIEAEFALPPGRLAVLWSAEKDRPEPTAFHPHGIGADGQPFALVLNAGRPEKNAPAVVAAFDRLFAEGRDPFGLGGLRVLLVGVSSLAELGIETLAHAERFTPVPEVSPGQLEYLFGRARMLVYASLNEGFGYPPVEAMRYGTPSVVARVAAIPEVCGDAAVYCDPRNIDSIAAAILQAFHDPPAAERLLARHAAIVERQRRDLDALVRLVLDGERPIEAPDPGPPASRPTVATKPGSVLHHAGWCPICEQATTFSAVESWLRDHYICERCQSLPRERALMVVLQTRFPDWRQLRIHESSPEMRGLSRKLARECHGYVASQFDPHTPCGALEPRGRWRSEDLERQTFEAGSFDIVITQDVFEHIFDVEAAFREVQRTLRPGGAHLLTTPLVRGEAPSRRRAERNGHGVVHREPQEFHGNPMSAEGSLVTWDWGHDIVDQIRAFTGDDAVRIVLEIPALGVVAAYLDVIVVERRRPADERGRRILPRRLAAH